MNTADSNDQINMHALILWSFLNSLKQTLDLDVLNLPNSQLKRLKDELNFNNNYHHYDIWEKYANTYFFLYKKVKISLGLKAMIILSKWLNYLLTLIVNLKTQ